MPPNVDNRDQSFPAFAVVALVTGLWLYFFWPVLTGDHVLAYRDSASHYYPLFEWIDSTWSKGELPVWNHQDDMGRPVMADPTASVFYPGKLVFFLPFLEFPVRFGVFVCIHVLLAAAGAYWAARVFGCHQAGSALAAIAFAFGAPVLFQTCNVIYLVGAAWLPVGIGCLWSFRQSAEKKWLIAIGTVLAVMVLGGDVQMAYHLAIISTALILLTQNQAANSQDPSLGSLSFRKRISSIGTFAIIAGVLCAVQIVPSYLWARKAFRNTTEVPRSIYEVPEHVRENGLDVAGFKDGLIGQPQPGTHHDHAYQFSYPPWMSTELVWPNVHGRMFPEYRRWSDGLPGADMTWVPSIFCGSIVCLLACTQIRWKRRDSQDRFMVWLFLIFGLGSFGWYGIGWLLDEFSLLVFGARGPAMGHPVGGIYWLMCSVLPGYISFRYPAKLTVVMAFALVMLASRAVSEKQDAVFSKRCKILSVFVAAASMFLLLVSFAAYQPIGSWLQKIPGDPVFGAFSSSKALLDLRFGLIHGLLASVLLLLFIQRMSNSKWQNRFDWMVVVVTALELAIAVKWMVPTVDIGNVEFRTETSTGDQRLLRLDPKYEQSSDQAVDPMANWLTWKQRTLYPKHHLLSSVEVVGSYSPIEPLDWMIWVEQGGFAISEARRAMSIDAVYDLNGVEHLENRHPYARLVFDCEKLPTIDNRSIVEVRERTVTVLDRMVESNGATTVVETDLNFELGTANEIDKVGPIKFVEPGKLFFYKQSSEPTLMVVSRYFDSDWKAEICLEGTQDWVPVPTVRANRVMTAIPLPAGSFDVRLVYRPWALYGGAAVSAIAWMVIFVWFYRQIRRQPAA